MVASPVAQRSVAVRMAASAIDSTPSVCRERRRPLTVSFRGLSIVAPAGWRRSPPLVARSVKQGHLWACLGFLRFSGHPRTNTICIGAERGDRLGSQIIHPL